MSVLSVKGSQKTLQGRPRKMNLHLLLTPRLERLPVDPPYILACYKRQGRKSGSEWEVVAKNARIYRGEATKRN